MDFTLERVIEQISIHFNSDIAFEEAADLKRKTVDNWKRGRSQSYLKMIPKLCEMFGVTSDYLLGTDEPAAQDRQPATERERLMIEASRELEDLPQGDLERILEIVRAYKRK